MYGFSQRYLVLVCWRIKCSMCCCHVSAHEPHQKNHTFFVELPDLNAIPIGFLAKRSRLLSWTTPGVRTACENVGIWPADLDVFGCGLGKVKSLKYMFFLLDLAFLPWDEHHRWKQTCLKKKHVLQVITLIFFHPCHANPSWLGNSHCFLGDGFNMFGCFFCTKLGTWFSIWGDSKGGKFNN